METKAEYIKQETPSHAQRYALREASELMNRAVYKLDEALSITNAHLDTVDSIRAALHRETLSLLRLIHIIGDELDQLDQDDVDYTNANHTIAIKELERAS